MYSSGTAMPPMLNFMLNVRSDDARMTVCPRILSELNPVLTRRRGSSSGCEEFSISFSWSRAHQPNIRKKSSASLSPQLPTWSSSFPNHEKQEALGSTQQSSFSGVVVYSSYHDNFLPSVRRFVVGLADRIGHGPPQRPFVPNLRVRRAIVRLPALLTLECDFVVVVAFVASSCVEHHPSEHDIWSSSSSSPVFKIVAFRFISKRRNGKGSTPAFRTYPNSSIFYKALN